uniref:RING-type domain-containing protein n=1 Tax=Haemonchus placei TaxID=6290 RepID=A0A0N4VVQ8_HAEPC
LEPCEGPCHASYEIETMVALPCCQVYMCQPCAKKWTEGKGTCPPGKCLQKGGSKIKTPCSGMPDCEGEVLRNFPSEMECEHEVCINCLAKTLDECEHNTPPICPNEACRLPYRCETVLALRALFPERAAYFSRFDLESHYSIEALKDDSITLIHVSIHIIGTRVVSGTLSHTHGHGFKSRIGNRLGHCPVEFVKNGPLGDLIREIRRVLKIMNTDKVRMATINFEKEFPKILGSPCDTSMNSCKSSRDQIPLETLHS